MDKLRKLLKLAPQIPSGSSHWKSKSWPKTQNRQMMIDSGQLPSKIMGQYSHPIHFHFLLAQLKQLFSISTEHLWPFTQNDPPFDQNDQNFPPFSSYYIAILIMIIVMLGHSKKEAIILPFWLMHMPYTTEVLGKSLWEMWISSNDMNHQGWNFQLTCEFPVKITWVCSGKLLGEITIQAKY